MTSSPWIWIQSTIFGVKLPRQCCIPFELCSDSLLKAWLQLSSPHTLLVQAEHLIISQHQPVQQSFELEPEAGACCASYYTHSPFCSFMIRFQRSFFCSIICTVLSKISMTEKTPRGHLWAQHAALCPQLYLSQPLKAIHCSADDIHKTLFRNLQNTNEKPLFQIP